MVIVIGEILMDIVKGDNIVYHPGGAPLNCATFLKKLGDEVGFYGVVGDDDLGKELIAFAKKQNFDYSRIDQIPNKKTKIIGDNMNREIAAAILIEAFFVKFIKSFTSSSDTSIAFEIFIFSFV